MRNLEWKKTSEVDFQWNMQHSCVIRNRQSWNEQLRWRFVTLRDNVQTHSVGVSWSPSPSSNQDHSVTTLDDSLSPAFSYAVAQPVIHIFNPRFIFLIWKICTIFISTIDSGPIPLMLLECGVNTPIQVPCARVQCGLILRWGQRPRYSFAVFWFTKSET